MGFRPPFKWLPIALLPAVPTAIAKGPIADESAAIAAPADCAKGQVAGAINLPAVAVYQAGNLAKRPPDRRIVVADSNGMTAVGVSDSLSTLVYNARGPQYGMMGRRADADDALMVPFKRFPADRRDDPIAAKP